MVAKLQVTWIFDDGNCLVVWICHSLTLFVTESAILLQKFNWWETRETQMFSDGILELYSVDSEVFTSVYFTDLIF